jgi:thiamine pyrophosphokinase
VGDWDSFTGELPAEVIRLTLPRAKDRNDLHFAAALAVAAGARELVFLGITGGRPDHQLANLYEVGALASIEGVRQVMIAGEDADYWFLGKSARSWSGKLPRGALASVFALGGTARGVSLTGFRYPLRDASLKLSSRGLSNEVTSAAGVCRVGLRSGSLMLIAPCR